LFTDALTTLATAAAQQDPPGILTLPQYDWESGELVDRGCLLDPFYNPVPNLDPERKDVAMVIGACLWIERDLWEKLGGFPEWFESIGEDLYLCCKARLTGTSVEVAKTSGYRHRQGHSFGGNKSKDNKLTSNLKRRKLSERNKTFTLIITTPGGVMWPLLALHLCLLSLEWVAMSIATRKVNLCAKIYGTVAVSIVRKRKILLFHRQNTQSNKSATILKYFKTFTPAPQKVKLLCSFGFPRLA